ncbi:uncharacterized protein PG986_013796 [Apiospora aurea]|uniref:Uncharacterized protein n=1 Tax=Apiospora aurea TaxID=335848 RepID=A0ABR1PWM6_9PEZI
MTASTAENSPKPRTSELNRRKQPARHWLRVRVLPREENGSWSGLSIDGPSLNGSNHDYCGRRRKALTRPLVELGHTSQRRYRSIARDARMVADSGTASLAEMLKF